MPIAPEIGGGCGTLHQAQEGGGRKRLLAIENGSGGRNQLLTIERDNGGQSHEAKHEQSTGQSHPASLGRSEACPGPQNLARLCCYEGFPRPPPYAERSRMRDSIVGAVHEVRISSTGRCLLAENIVQCSEH